MKISRYSDGEREYQEVLDFYKKIEKDFYPPLSQRPSVKGYLDNTLRNNGTIIYLKKNNKIVSLVSYYYHSEKYNSPYIVTVATLKSYRRKGFATILLKKCLSDLKNKKLKKVKVRTWSKNKASLHFYKKLGFKPYKIVKNDRGKNINTIYFQKDLK